MPVRWQDTVRTAGDLAVLGFLVVLAALPVVTAGAAVLTGSAAVRHHLQWDTWPSAAESRRTFRRAFLPGLAGLAAVAVVAWLIAVDLRAVSAGRVPGGLPVTAALILLAAGAAGLTGLAVVEAAGPRTLLRRAAARPVVPIALAGVVVLAAALVLLIHPVLTPVLLGYTLFALHVVTASLTGTEQALTGTEQAPSGTEQAPSGTEQAPFGGTEQTFGGTGQRGGNLSSVSDHI